MKKPAVVEISPPFRTHCWPVRWWWKRWRLDLQNRHKWKRKFHQMLDHQKTKNFPKEVRLSRGQTKHLMRKTTTKNQHSLFLFFRLDPSGVYCYPHPHSCEYFIHVVNKFFSGFIIKLCPHGRQKVLFKTPLEPIFCTKGFAVGHIERYPQWQARSFQIAASVNRS